MSLYRALVSFSGEVAGTPGQVVEINDKDVVKDYLNAGYIEKLSKEDEAAEQAKIDAENKRIEEAEEARQKQHDEVVLPNRSTGEDAASTQHRLNEELRGNEESKSAKEELGSAEEATAAYEGAETNAQDAAANPKPTVNAVKSGQTSQGGVNVDPPKDGDSTLGTSQAEDDPSATIPEEKQEENQAAVEAQDAADKAAAEAKKDELPENEPGVKTTAKPRSVNRSAKTGKIVSAEEAKANPDTTVTEKVK